MRILFWQWHSFMGRGVEKAFQELKIAYDTFFYQLSDWENDVKFQQRLEEQIREHLYDAVFSINYTPLISEVCENCGILYFSWVYDSPMHIRNEAPMKKKCNRIYWFDRGQVKEYQKRGIEMHYLPLAADSSVFETAFLNSQTHVYDSEVAMVGQLYQTEYSYYSAPLDEYLKGYLEGVISSQLRIYGAYFLEDLLTEEIMKSLNRVYQKASNGKVSVEKREMEFLLASEITRRERYLVLSLLSKHFQVKLYSSQRDENLHSVIAMGYIDYYTQMPLVFANSKINLNISLKTIRTGIPLRVLDVLSCGGFLISNYQEELGEYFRIGEELIVYQDLEELAYLTEYYLKHENERKNIAEKGRERIKSDFRFEDRVQEMLKEL